MKTALTTEPKSRKSNRRLTPVSDPSAESTLQQERRTGAPAGMPSFLATSLQRKLSASANNDPLPRGNNNDATSASRVRRSLGNADRQRPFAGDDRFSPVAHEIAKTGFRENSIALPHMVRIQQSFGRHDITHVEAHVGGAAAQASNELGARAYARGEQVAFREEPELRTAAHEAAHVVQQRQGALQLRGGVGQAGDRFEQQADAVADLVVQGKSAESMLGPLDGDTRHPGPSIGLQLDGSDEDGDFYPFSDIETLPSRAHYEASGELKPRLSPGLSVAPNMDLIDIDESGAVMPAFSRAPAKKLDLSAFGHPNPIPESIGASADVMTAPQMVLRLSAMEVVAVQIAQLVASDSYLSDLMTAAQSMLESASSRAWGGRKLPDFTLSAGDLKADEVIPSEPVPLTHEIVRSERVLDRVYEAVIELDADRQVEEITGQNIAATSANRPGPHYDQEQYLSENRYVRRLYIETANRVLQPRIVRDFNQADQVHGETNEALQRRKLTYYETLRSSVKKGEKTTNAINAWAGRIEDDLTWLKEQAPRLRAARESNTLDPALDEEFASRAALVATSIEALAEYDAAASAYEALAGHSALWGYEDARRIRWRLEQMSAAALDRDVDYLKLLLRDHQKDPKIAAFYQSIPSIIAWSSLIISFAIMLVASLATAGVGLAFAAVTGIAENAVVLLSWNFVIRSGLQAITFTLISRSLQSLFPGMAPTSPLWVDLLWNLGLFGVMSAAGIAMRASLKTMGSLTRMAVSQGVNFGILQAYGFIRGSIEAGHVLSGDEVLEMTKQNLIMMVGMGVAMKGFEPMMAHLEEASALSRFKRSYGGSFADIESARTALASQINETMRARPDVTSEALEGFRSQARELDQRLNFLVEQAMSDPTIDAKALRSEAAEIFRRIERTSLPEVLRLTGLDPSFEIMPTGRDGSWSFPKGRAAALRTFLIGAGYEVILDTSTAGGRVIEASVPGKGRIQLIERATTERVVVPLTEGEIASARMHSEESAALDVAGGTRGRGVYDLAEAPVQTAKTVATAAERLARGIAREGLHLEGVSGKQASTTGTLRVEVPAGARGPATTVNVNVVIEVVPDLALSSRRDFFSTHGEEAGHARIVVSGDAHSGWTLNIKLDARLASEVDVQHNLRHELREGGRIIAELVRDPAFDVRKAQSARVLAPGDATDPTIHDRVAAEELRDLMNQLGPELRAYKNAREQVALNRGGAKARFARDAGEIAMRRLDAALEANGFADPATRAAKTKALLEMLGETKDSQVGRYVEEYGEREDAAIRRRAAIERLSGPDREAMAKTMGSDLETHVAKYMPDGAIDPLNEAIRHGGGSAAREMVRQHAAGRLTDQELVSALTQEAAKAGRLAPILDGLRAKKAVVTQEIERLTAERDHAQRWETGASIRVSSRQSDARTAALKEVHDARAQRESLEREINAQKIVEVRWQRQIATVERELQGPKREFVGIGATGSVGEEFLRSLGGESQVRRPTKFGDRVIDQLVNRRAHESKVGKTDLDPDTALQIAKDKWLRDNNIITGSTWHFFESPITGERGPTERLLRALEAAGIEVKLETVRMF